MSDDQYYSLSEASRMLGVHSTTLRRWADTGAIPVYVTPGGHRRFARSDIEALVERRPLNGQLVTSAWAKKALAQTRSDLTQARQEPRWLVAIGDGDRDAWRRIGQQLMGLVLRYVNSAHEDPDLLNEARIIGATYAQLAANADLSLSTALEAALFFRDSLVDAAMTLPEEAHIRPDESARLLRRISRVANVVQLAVVEGYEQTHS